MAAVAALDPAHVREAILSVRHGQWYRVEYEGGCPRKDKNACSALFSYDALPREKTASLNDIKSCLSKKTDICPDEKEEKEEEEEEKQESTPRRDASSRLCELHRRQATWRNWGTSCDDSYCHGHEWPSEKDAPVLYRKSTSPRQAVILLHFGLLKESHVDKLVMNNFPVALFVMHLMHNTGMKFFFSFPFLIAMTLSSLGKPDNSAMDLLARLSQTCLSRLWDDSENEVSSPSPSSKVHGNPLTRPFF